MNRYDMAPIPGWARRAGAHVRNNPAQYALGAGVGGIVGLDAVSVMGMRRLAEENQLLQEELAARDRMDMAPIPNWARRFGHEVWEHPFPYAIGAMGASGIAAGTASGLMSRGYDDYRNNRMDMKPWSSGSWDDILKRWREGHSRFTGKAPRPDRTYKEAVDDRIVDSTEQLAADLRDAGEMDNFIRNTGRELREIDARLRAAAQPPPPMTRGDLARNIGAAGLAGGGLGGSIAGLYAAEKLEQENARLAAMLARGEGRMDMAALPTQNILAPSAINGSLALNLRRMAGYTR